MGNAEQFRVRYVGSAPFAGAVAQALTEEGIEVTWTPPEERRDYQTVAEAVVVYYLCKGGDAAIKAAVQKVREKLKRSGRGTVELDDEGPADRD